jgi:hypothetical protein
MAVFMKKFFVTILTFVFLSATTSIIFGQVSIKKTDASKPAAATGPLAFDGTNLSCANLNASALPAFSHIDSDNQLKLDFATPNGSFSFTELSGSQFGRVVTGPQYADRSVTVTSSGSTVMSWSSQIAITAVILKVGNTSYVFPYAPSASTDTDLVTGDNRSISHLSFCYGQPMGYSAGTSSLSGRVVTVQGRPISGVRITLLIPATSEVRTAVTSPFGYYTFDELEAGQIYILTAGKKGVPFVESAKVLTLYDSIADVDFLASGL